LFTFMELVKITEKGGWTQTVCFLRFSKLLYLKYFFFCVINIYRVTLEICTE
jgi:hypothetical protein